jgi:hypothetical protein
MNTETFRQEPWTCRWGRFGVIVDEITPDTRIDDVFWGCDHPVHSQELRLMRRGECEHCPFWKLASRFTVRC